MDRRLTYDLIGNDKVSPTFAKVAVAAEEANRRMADSNGRLSVAEKKLTDLRTQGKASVTQLAAAEENVARLRRASESASLKLADAQSKLSSTAQSAGKDMAKLGSDAGSSAGQIGLLGPAIAAGVLVIGPAVGAATAAVVGLGAAAGVALLAYKGLQNEMANGTALGKTVQAQFKGISGELTTLETIAVRNAGPGIISALSQVKQFLPTLNPLVGQLAAQLGKALSISTGGLISGLKTMQPLMSDAGGYAIRLAQAFANFANSQQFRAFVDYARQELPQVGQAVTTLAVGLVRLGVDFHPVGDQLVKDIDGIAVALNGLESVGEKAKSIFDKIQIGPKGGLFGNIFVNTSFAHVLASLAGGSKTSTQAQKDAAAATLAATAAVNQHKAALAAAAAQAGVSVATYQAVTGAMISQAQATQNAAYQMREENDAAGILKTSLDNLSGKALSTAQAQSQFDQAIVSVDKHTDKAGATLLGMSDAAVKNRSDLLNLVTSAQNLSEAYGNQTKSSEAGRQKLIDLRKEIIDNAVANGENRAQVTAYIDSVLKIPKSVPPTQVDIDKAKADAKLADLKKKLGDTTVARTVRVFADTSSAIASLQSFAAEEAATQAAMSVVVPAPGPGSAHRSSNNTGGFIVGPGTATSDSIPARLSNGEYVIQASAVSKYGLAMFDALNGKRFKSGGPVGPSFSSEESTLFGITGNLARVIAAALGSPAAIASAFSGLISGINQAVLKGMASSGLITALSRENAQLQAVATRRQQIAAAIKTDSANLANAQQAYNTTAQTVAGAVTGSFGLLNVTGATTSGQVLAQLQQKVASARQFGANLTKLRKEGLSGSLLLQLAAAGPDQAGSIAQALANGPAIDIRSLNGLAASDQQAANAIGLQTANAINLPAVKVASQQLKTQEAMLAKLDKQAEALAKIAASQAAGGVHFTINPLPGNEAATARAIIGALEKYLGHKVHL